jgi:hypothetical protein
MWESDFSWALGLLDVRIEFESKSEETTPNVVALQRVEIALTRDVFDELQPTS